MMLSSPIQLGIASLSALTVVSALDNAAIFKNPVVARAYQQQTYVLSGKDPWENDNVSVAEVASSLIALKPTYVNSLLYLSHGSVLSPDMISNFKLIRSTVRKQVPDARFDVEISLNPNGYNPFPNASAVVAQMKYLNANLPLDGFWYDFLSSAQTNKSDWVKAAANYAHGQNQTIGGNIFDTTVVPPNVDGVSFDDKIDPSNKQFGYGINNTKVKEVVEKAKGTKTQVLGHLNSNPQNNENITESCVYMRNWTATERVQYLNYWVNLQPNLNFTYMLPLFFPLCPNAVAYSPLEDDIKGTNQTVYDKIKAVAETR